MTDAPRDDLVVGRMLAERYRIEAPLARGGMARVYRARDVRLERDVAIKVLSQPYADDAGFVERFLAEARAAASLSHPSLVHVYDSGSSGDAHFIVMELLDSHRSLRQVIDADGPLSRDEVLRIGRELLAGLRLVHDRGLVHCDVKSGNVMLGPGPAKLIDFGIARAPNEALEGDTSIGSLQFMSPEQLHGDALTPASDLFSLGVVLYEALTGRMPYAGRTPEEISAAHAAGDVRPPSTFVPGLPARLEAAILQSLRREPASRFHTAEAMTRALEGADAAGPGSGDADETRV
ncbi:MAG TPA: serine/threonine-protein kinase, partial [Candidatus Limnocylindria bacterium]